ncbi:phage lytic cycle repressor MrpR family protein [Parasporobacterium paucivorans]|uniref:MrpR N-terminal core-binding domain-containing protein n=1 Tax=Parasporobacterium paucivorans DSM 15970 TaxID=1122934 RepID=A0A1M6GZK7_9FIRM|nr:hypothetical protein [Parasporobacterium paucivorans]SHJ15333.1 hypothetical protein SAMN02745691_01439 [Parasporobacterium paucivorans DSM 15970]
MVNQKFKEEFIRTYNSGKYEGYVWNIFKKTEDSEEKFKKDVASFELNEIEALLQSFGSTSIQSLRVIACILRKYTAYAVTKKLPGVDLNHFDEVTTALLENCVHKSERNEKFISRNRLLNFVAELPNSGDQFLIMALYEGLGGDLLSEITMTAGAGINEDKNIISLYGGRTIECSSRLIAVARDAADNYRYESLNEKSLNQREMRLISDRIFKARNNATEPDAYHAYHRALRRLNEIREYLGYRSLNVGSLRISGFAQAILDLMDDQDMPFRAVYKTDEFKELASRYGYRKYAFSRLKVTLGEYMDCSA